MTSRQCEIAAESYSAYLLARTGHDVLIQYGANQPQYDLVAVKGDQISTVSVKGSQDGGWMLAVKYVKAGTSYHAAIDKWLEHQRMDTVYLFVQFKAMSLGEPPRAYVAVPPEIAVHMKSQCLGRGHGSLQEDWQRDHAKSQYDHKIPPDWVFTAERFAELQVAISAKRASLGARGDLPAPGRAVRK